MPDRSVPEPARHRFETRLALLALVVAFLHGTGEAIWEIFFDQFILALLIDVIAVALLVWAGTASLKARPGSAIGLLAGAWGFMAAFIYRVFSWRFEERLAEGASRVGEPDWLLLVLGLELTVSLGALAVSMALASPRRSGSRAT